MIRFALHIVVPSLCSLLILQPCSICIPWLLWDQPSDVKVVLSSKSVMLLRFFFVCVCMYLSSWEVCIVVVCMSSILDPAK